MGRGPKLKTAKRKKRGKDYSRVGKKDLHPRTKKTRWGDEAITPLAKTRRKVILE